MPIIRTNTSIGSVRRADRMLVLLAMAVDYFALYLITQGVDALFVKIGFDAFDQYHVSRYPKSWAQLLTDTKIDMPNSNFLVCYSFLILWVLSTRSMFSPGSTLFNLDLINTSRSHSKVIGVLKCLLIQCWMLPIDLWQISGIYPVVAGKLEEHILPAYWCFTVFLIYLCGDTFDEVVFDVVWIQEDDGVLFRQFPPGSHPTGSTMLITPSKQSDNHTSPISSSSSSSNSSSNNNILSNNKPSKTPTPKSSPAPSSAATPVSAIKSTTKSPSSYSRKIAVSAASPNRSNISDEDKQLLENGGYEINAFQQFQSELQREILANLKAKKSAKESPSSTPAPASALKDTELETDTKKTGKAPSRLRGKRAK